MSSSQRTVQLTKKNIVKIIAAAPGIDLDDELYAVNWFDLKRPRLYDYYNQLAYPHLKRAGGKVHFKGTVTRKLRGPEENDRQMLLLVRYPNAQSFLDMLNNRMFLLKSVMRIKSVDYFTFGFTRRMGGGAAPLTAPMSYRGNGKYFFHHFQSRQQISKELYDLAEVVDRAGLKTHFMGYRAALIGRINPGMELRTQPFLMDGLMLLESDQQEKIDAFIADPDYRKICSDNRSNNTYMINRVL